MTSSSKPLWQGVSIAFGRLALAVLLVGSASLSFAQGIQLSAEQQQMLNQLPPAQRQQAMDSIRQLQSQQSLSAQQSINEQPAATPAEGNEDKLDAILTPDLPVAKGRSRLIIEFTASDEAEVSDDPAIRRLEGSQLYILDEDGVLSLPGYEPIPLLGLSEEDIGRRLAAEPYMDSVWINVRILGQETVGAGAIQPFGYSAFEAERTSLDAPASGPVPPDYVLGPGDSLRVQLFGNVNGIYEFEVSRDGILNLPEIGPVTVAGLPFSEFRTDLTRRVKEMLIGTQVSVTMGALRTIRVFVLGDVKAPGSYVVGGLSTVSAALSRSGGISTIGSLRNIQLKRNGRVVATLDAYDLLIRGDNSGDSRLQQGDVIFVPPIGKTVSVAGAVNRPAIYEVKRLTTAADLVGLAGGLKPEAYESGARLERIGESGEREVVPVDLGNESANKIRIRTGDSLFVPEVLPEVRNAVTLSGHVYRPGNYPWRPGMRLSDLVSSSNELQPGADMEYVLIRREIERSGQLQALSASLGAALQARGSGEDVLLQSGDIVNVFSLAFGRQRVVEPLLEEMRLQATIDAPVRKVQISGNVRAPGEYPLETDMRVSDLIRAGGDLTEAAYALEAELTRYSVGGGGRDIDVVKVDLDAIRRGDGAADLALREYDYLIISRLPDWDSTWTVTLEGEVLFPGDYRVRRGETLAEVVQRAGGLTDSAYVEGAVFLRESLKAQEQEQIENLARRLEADLATLSLQAVASDGSETLSTGRVLLDQLRSTEAVGRLVIDLRRDSDTIASSVEMRDGDTLLVPTRPQVVSVLGETQQNTSHLYRDDLSRDEYIDLSGGLTRRADKKLIYVVRANGAVVAGNRSRWFGRRHNVDIRPGDTIVVPLDTDRMRPLTFWGNVTQILYQGAIAVAAVKTFDD